MSRDASVLFIQSERPDETVIKKNKKKDFMFTATQIALQCDYHKYHKLNLCHFILFLRKSKK